MSFRFSKLKKDGDLDVTYIDDNKVSHLLPCVFLDGSVDVSGFYSVDPTGSELTYNRLVREINLAYAEHNRKKADGKRQRDEIKAVNHWWNTMTSRDKHKLIRPLKDRLIDIVDALLEKNPNDIKRQHYESLIKRSQLKSIEVCHKLDARKLAKLPRYDAEFNTLCGSAYSFIALAEVCYPSLRRDRISNIRL